MPLAIADVILMRCRDTIAGLLVAAAFRGLHKTATKLFSHTEDYEQKIGWWLELSKAIRAFLFPLCALIGYLRFFPGTPWPFPENTLLSIFWNWQVDLLALALALGLYLSFRVLHVRRLYEHLRASEPILEQGPEASDSVFVQMPVPRKDLPYMTPAEPIPDYWLWFLAEGVILFLLGMAAIVVPPIAGLTATIFIGWMLLVRGVADVVVTLWGRHSPGFVWSLLSAVVALAAGVVLLMWPIQGLVTPTYVLITYFAVDGILTISLGIVHERASRWMMWFNGIVDLILAVIVFAGLPEAFAWPLGRLVGIDFVLGGILLIAKPGVVQGAKLSIEGLRKAVAE